MNIEIGQHQQHHGIKQLSAIWGEYRQTFPIYFYVLEVLKLEHSRDLKAKIFSILMSCIFKANLILYYYNTIIILLYYTIFLKVWTVDCTRHCDRQSWHLFLAELLFKLHSNIFCITTVQCAPCQQGLQSSHCFGIWRSDILYTIDRDRVWYNTYQYLHIIFYIYPISRLLRC